ncbi:hypothetical protein Tco_0933110 [Tanacetum coccineum]
MDSSSIQENVEALQLIPHQQPVVEEAQLKIQIIPIEDHADASAILERLTYARFISLILEKALGDSYVLYNEIGLKIPIMGNSIFRLDPTLLEVPISSHMVRVCQSVSDPVVVSKDVAGILLCDNVSDGSPSVDSNLNEIVKKLKTKLITSLLDPKSKESIGVYKFKVVTNCLNEEVVFTIELYFVKIDYQLADLFAKVLPVDRFNYLIRCLSMRSLPPQELERLAKS